MNEYILGDAKYKKIILFDGVCNFCDNTINYILSRDQKQVFNFASLQSDVGIAILKEYNMDCSDLDSIVYLEDNKAYVRSTAILLIFSHLKSSLKYLYILIYLPESIRDTIYRWFAKRRYKWFGRKESCVIPNEKIRSRFLS